MLNISYIFTFNVISVSYIKSMKNEFQFKNKVIKRDRFFKVTSLSILSSPGQGAPWSS